MQEKKNYPEQHEKNDEALPAMAHDDCAYPYRYKQIEQDSDRRLQWPGKFRFCKSCFANVENRPGLFGIFLFQIGDNPFPCVLIVASMAARRCKVMRDFVKIADRSSVETKSKIFIESWRTVFCGDRNTAGVNSRAQGEYLDQVNIVLGITNKTGLIVAFP